MTKVGKLYEEERLAYGREIVENIVRKMLNRGRPINEIAEVSGLTEIEVVHIRNSMDHQVIANYVREVTENIARNLLNMDYSVEVVVQATGLTKNDVLKLNHDTNNAPSPTN